ncbi:MAG: hypothetical protein ACRD40_14865 [Candidatus Acidiferrales bacterium]
MPRVVEQESVRKPYEPPVLTIYGTVYHVTRSNGRDGSLDGGQQPLKMNTSFA